MFALSLLGGFSVKECPTHERKRDPDCVFHPNENRTVFQCAESSALCMLRKSIGRVGKRALFLCLWVGLFVSCFLGLFVGWLVWLREASGL